MHGVTIPSLWSARFEASGVVTQRNFRRGECRSLDELEVSAYLWNISSSRAVGILKMSHSNAGTTLLRGVPSHFITQHKWTPFERSQSRAHLPVYRHRTTSEHVKDVEEVHIIHFVNIAICKSKYLHIHVWKHHKHPPPTLRPLSLPLPPSPLTTPQS